MNGLLIVNQFLNGSKYAEIYQLLQNAAQQMNISLAIKKSGELLHNTAYLRQLPYDFILFWDKDILLAKMLEACGFPVFNSADAIFHCDNKGYTDLILNQHHLRTPLTFTAPLTFEGCGYHPSDFTESIIERLGFPFIVKELYGSFGQQVYLVRDCVELDRVLDRVGCKELLFQEFISHSAGRDVRINVVGESVVSSMLRYSVNGDFRSNISSGGKAQKYEASPEQQAAAIGACRALGLDFAGVDVLFGVDGEPIVCEVNSNPHFKSSLDCTGVDISPLILAHIKRKAEKE